MKIGVYNIINDPLPKLNKIKDVEVKIKDFEYDCDIVNVMNRELKMDKLSAEYIYALSLTYELIPKGIIFVAAGTAKECEINMKDLATGLLLTGAEQFMCFHNHTGGGKEITYEDRDLTDHYIDLGETIGVNFLKHIMITQNYFAECKPTE